jgi:hypothetical protein
MRLRLVLLQFPLLYCFGVLVGLSVYGADFRSPSGFAYLLPLLVGPLMLPRLGAGTREWLARRARWLAASGVLLGALAYRPLHLGFWDEQSLGQAFALSAFGLFSLVVGWLAVTRVAAQPSHTPAPVASALVVVAGVFFLARWYPLIPILGATLCLAVAVTLRWERTDRDPAPRGTRRLFLSALAFYLAAEISHVVWDLGVDSSWGPQVALAFLAAATVALAWTAAGERASSAALRHPFFATISGLLALAVTGTTSAVTALHPAFVLNPLRQGVLGLALGGLIVAVLARVRCSAEGASTVQGVWVWFTIGLAVSNVYSTQFEAFPIGRLVFAVPAVAMFLLEQRRSVRVTADAPEPH